MLKAVLKNLALLARAGAFYFAFALIAVGSFLLGHIVIPVLTLINPARTQMDNRLLVSAGARLYLQFLSTIGLLRVECRGLDPELLEEPLVFAANHPSLLDAVFFLSRFPNCVVIIKSELMNFSPYSRAAKAAGYIVNNGSTEIVDPLCDELKLGNPVVIFPEGTRTSFPDTRGEEALETWLNNIKFHRGAAAVSLRASVPIVPVLMNYSPEVLGRGQKWYQIPNKLCEASIDFFEPVFIPNSIYNQDSPSKRRELTERLEHFFKQYLAHGAKGEQSFGNFQPSAFHASLQADQGGR